MRLPVRVAFYTFKYGTSGGITHYKLGEGDDLYVPAIGQRVTCTNVDERTVKDFNIVNGWFVVDHINTTMGGMPDNIHQRVEVFLKPCVYPERKTE